jgi:hypothetical protein
MDFFSIEHPRFRDAAQGARLCKPSRALGKAPESIHPIFQGGKSHKGIAVLSAQRRQSRRDRGRYGGHAPELYQRMLAALSEQIRLADDLSYDSVSFTEHHCHIEGFESPTTR